MTTIVTKNGSGAPLASDLVQGELAVDLTNKRLYTEDSGGTVIEVGTNPSTIDINAGTIDGTVIGGASAAAGTFTTFTSTGIDDNATSTAITIDASENVGIGTASPLNRLDVVETDTTAESEIVASFRTSSGGYLYVQASDKSIANPTWNIGTATSEELTFGANNAERMRIDSSGNVGIGVTPSAWDSVFKNIQIGGSGYSGSFYSQANGDISDGIVLNAYYNGGWKYTASSKTATQYEQNNGIHKWAVAPSGTAGNAISWSEAMRIDSSGRVGIGNTNPSYKLEVSGPGSVLARLSATDSAQAYMAFTNSTTGGGLFADGSIVGLDSDESAVFYNFEATPMRFGTSGIERMRIDSSGVLLVGTTSTGGVAGGSTNGAYISGDSNSAFSRSTTLNRSQIAFYNPNGLVGQIGTSGSSTYYNTSSDYRLKENVVTLDNATDRLKQIPVHRFNFIADPDTVVDGFIAHEVQDVVPEAITGTKDAVDAEGNPEYQGIDQSKLVPLLTAALQEAVTRIETLEAEVAALKGA